MRGHGLAEIGEGVLLWSGLDFEGSIDLSVERYSAEETELTVLKHLGSKVERQVPYNTSTDLDIS